VAEVGNAILNILAPNKRKEQHSLRAFTGLTGLADRKAHLFTFTKYNESSETQTGVESKGK
jgi:hypothetical protein